MPASDLESREKIVCYAIEIMAPRWLTACASIFLVSCLQAIL
jgi:hypothetical protein